MQKITNNEIDNKLTKTTTVNKYLNNNCYTTVNSLVGKVQDLANPQFHSWYCTTAYKLGAERFLKCAQAARQGKSPAKLFSFLLRAELNVL